MDCVLRQWKEEDAESLAGILNNKKILDNLRDGLPFPYTSKDALEYIKTMNEADKDSVFAFAFVLTACLREVWEFSDGITYIQKLPN